VPYTVLDKVAYPPKFQNVGINYLEFHADEGEVRPATAPASMARTGPDSVRFSFNDCPHRDAFCSIFIDVKKDGKLLHVRVTGDVLSQTSQWVSPNWSQRLAGVFLRLKCNSKTASVKTILVDKIGVTIDVTRFRSLTRTLAAPLERLVENPCAGPISKLSAGYARSLVYTTYSDRLHFPGREATATEF
jgi:hypothetical protein